MTVKEISRIFGVSVRTLHYYDEIGLLTPRRLSDSDYRIYEAEDIRKLQTILLFKELDFPLKEIRNILESSDFDFEKIVLKQVELLKLRKNRIEKIINFAEKIATSGEFYMDEVFNDEKIKEYAKEAKEIWGETKEYKEYEEKNAHISEEKQQELVKEMMSIFELFGKIKEESPESINAQTLVRTLQEFINKNYYTCSKDIFMCLGQMYAAEGEMKQNIDNAGGTGTANFVAEAIQIYCTK